MLNAHSWQLAILTVVWVGGVEQRGRPTFIRPQPPLAGWVDGDAALQGESELFHTEHLALCREK